MTTEVVAAALAPWRISIVTSPWMADGQIVFMDGKMLGNAWTIRNATRSFHNPEADKRWASDWWHGGETRGWWES